MERILQALKRLKDQDSVAPCSIPNDSTDRANLTLPGSNLAPSSFFNAPNTPQPQNLLVVSHPNTNQAPTAPLWTAAQNKPACPCLYTPHIRKGETGRLPVQRDLRGWVGNPRSRPQDSNSQLHLVRIHPAPRANALHLHAYSYE